MKCGVTCHIPIKSYICHSKPFKLELILVHKKPFSKPCNKAITPILYRQCRPTHTTRDVLRTDGTLRVRASRPADRESPIC